MAKANHYCFSCGFHFRATIEQHAETYHESGVFQGVENGTFRDFPRRLKRNR
jgi:hypothetical protein